MRGPIWLFLYLYVLVAVASVIPQNQRCVTAVYTAYGYISFSGTPAKGSWNSRCQNSLEVTSIYAASDRYCSVPERQAGLSELEVLCRQYAGVGLIPRERLAENLTDDAVRNMRVVEYLELSRRNPIASPVLISPAYYEVTFRTIDSWQFETWSHYAYGYAGYAFWMGILAIGMLHRWIQHIVESRPRRGSNCWPDTSDQILRYVADRTGILSFANFPLIWLFAGRNNVFLWATGWSFATFNIFHRHIAWIATIQDGNAWRKLQKPYLFWGTVGMVAMVLLLPLAMDFFRQRTYECFLFLHILLSVATLVGCFYHTIIFEGQEYWFYLWPAVGVWGFDRLLRLIRIIYCNAHVNLNLGKGILFTRSRATYDTAADVIRLEVFPGSPSLSPTPGQYYFVYQPFRLTGWESHPFTLGSWTYETPAAPATQSLVAKGDPDIDVSQVPLLSDSSSGSSRSLAEDDPKILKLVFWIRPFDGWTRHLQQQCTRSPDRKLETALLVEGPYGEPFPLSNYESVLLVVGGTGIAAAVPYIQDHLARCAEMSETTQPFTRDIHLVWTTRQEAFIQHVVTQDLEPGQNRMERATGASSTIRPAHHPKWTSISFEEGLICSL
ncbi:FRE family ferric-chelate reductase [Aspergillus terreus]|uniref:FRE family ferric-chelate reductase n=1 Tax=Aspergillus terreus TaxID=33178 RepID=A0A5M3ZEL1_ASPTE|nr:hypothetical protein ATETN484_0017007900 [Aspergillus terreus]GFF21750.1 FRE family ferric-chelate reductase [Aspergillus terreus]